MKKQMTFAWPDRPFGPSDTEAREWTSISELLKTLDQGWSPQCEASTAPDESWGVIKTTAIQALRFDARENKALPQGLHPRPHLEIEEGDVLMTRAGPRSRVGVACHVNVTRPKLMLCDKVYRLKVDRRVATPGYVAALLNAPPVVKWLDDNKTGISDSGVNLTQERLGGLQVPLVPLPEQQRIVEALDSYLSRLDDATKGLKRVEANLKRYRASVLKAAVEGRLVPTEADLAKSEGRTFEPASVLLDRILVERRRRWEEAELTKLKAKGETPKNDKWKAKYEEPAAPDVSELPELPEGWCWAKLDQLASIQGGIQKGKQRSGDAQLRHVPYLRVANVQRGFLDLGEVKTIEASKDEIEQLCLKPGDVLFNEGGDRDKLGRGWVWEGQLAQCIHQNHVFRARLLGSDLLPKFLSWYGNSSGQRYFFDEGKQTTNLASLNSSKLRALPVPLAPKAEQERIAAELERLLSEGDASLAIVTTNLRRIERLRQSILKWAFEGKLVDQDPNDEPAAALLARIRAERAATQHVPKAKAAAAAAKPGRGRKRAAKAT